MTIPPPHPDDVFAAALDVLGAALARVHTDPAAVDAVIVASQAVYVAGITRIESAIERVAQQVERLGRPAERRSDEELHDLRNKVQQIMDATLVMHENRIAIEKVYAQLQELAQQLTLEIAEREQLTKQSQELASQIRELRERVVGDQEPES